MTAGPPLPPFTDLRTEAESWAALADNRELAEYMRAGWLVLSTEQCLSFLRWAREHELRAIRARTLGAESMPRCGA